MDKRIGIVTKELIVAFMQPALYRPFTQQRRRAEEEGVIEEEDGKLVFPVERATVRV